MSTDSVSDQDGPPPVRVALSDDYEIALLGLAQMLARHPRQVQIVNLTTQARMPHETDIILYDTFGRVPDGDPKLEKIIAENTAKVVVYSWDDYPEEAARRAGVAGYLHKSMGADELVAAIVAIHDGGEALPPVDAEDAEPVMTWPGQADGLSQREAEMVSFVVRGLTNQEIADRCFLGINTVKTYLKGAYRKMGVSSRAQAVAWGIRHGFVSSDDTGV